MFVSNKQNICTINELIRKRYFENLCLRDRDEAKEYIAATLQETKIKESSYTVCPSCKKELKDTDITNINVCNNCNYHFKMNCIDRLKLIFDKRSTELFDENIYSENPIEFPGYDDKLEHLINTLNIKEAVITGKGEIFGSEIYFGIMDYRFIMGSMGSVVGEKLTRMVERATEESKPIIIFTASGGARMQEGMISLYQMAKVVAAIEKHSQKGLLYISVLTDPTTGGVIASFASIADIIIGEPNATIGFAGKRIIKNTTNEEFPKNFQTSEFYFENGHIDMICERKKMKKTISDIISFYTINIDSKLKLAQYKNISTTFSHKNPKEISPWHRVKLARNSNRPNFQDYINYIFNDFIELHGDRICSDDPAIVTGVGYIKGIPVTVILSAKEKSLDKNITRNFGMAKPEGYRKVMRIIKQAEKFGRPVISFIDTPGAHCCVEAERRGQGEAIANCIRSFTKLTTPSIAIITGEGGSGGALATGVADWIFIMENGIYSVISPEGCASILFKNKAKAKEASEYLRLTSDELLKLNIVDEVISEPNGGENIDSEYLTNNIKTRLFNKLIELLNLDTNILLHNRYNKFRKCGVFKEI
nr:acetyl-CoA carboxylase carboxyltransferase subunit alpha [Hathewaya histolytica]